MSIDYVTFSNLIVDDIVLPDGQTMMNTLGGAGTHALIGMRVWNSRLGYVAAVGSDLAQEHRRALERFGVDLQGLQLRDGYETARAWQLFEPDERRTEIFRTDMEEFERRKVTVAELPPPYWHARGFHLEWGTLSEMAQLIQALRAANPDVVLVWEPTPTHVEATPAALQQVLPQVDLFSPNLGEAAQMTGQTAPRAMCATLLQWGAPLLALRMGAEGSLLCTATGEAWTLPAVPATAAVDVTGAGNAYCGGFLTGLGDGLAPLEAGLRAAVSASFALEQFGLPAWQRPPAQEVRRRLAWARDRVAHGAAAAGEG